MDIIVKMCVPCGLGTVYMRRTSRGCRETTDADREGQPNPLFEGLRLEPMIVGLDKINI